MNEPARANGSPLHQRIRVAIETQIMAGTLRPGDRIPFEHELMAEYGCSRMTVNKALTALASAGLIRRHRRAGSFVTQPRIHMAALKIPDIREEVTQRGYDYTMRLISRQEGTDGGRERLLSLRVLHMADGRPFAAEDREINVQAVPGALHVDFAETPPGSWLLAHVPWTEAEHRISAVPAGDLAALLAIDAGHPCLLLERSTWRGKDSITHVRTTFPGQDFDLTARFVSQAEDSRSA